MAKRKKFVKKADTSIPRKIALKVSEKARRRLHIRQETGRIERGMMADPPTFAAALFLNLALGSKTEFSVEELVMLTGRVASQVSRELARFREANIVKYRRVGYRHYYSVSDIGKLWYESITGDQL